MTQPVGSAVGKPEAVGEQSKPEPLWAAQLRASGMGGQAVLLRDPPLQPSPHKPFGSPGLRSTEFWLCAFCACVGSVLALGWPQPLNLAGAALLGLATASYAYSRGKAKARTYMQGKL